MVKLGHTLPPEMSVSILIRCLIILALVAMGDYPPNCTDGNQFPTVCNITDDLLMDIQYPYGDADYWTANAVHIPTSEVLMVAHLEKDGRVDVTVALISGNRTYNLCLIPSWGCAGWQ